MIFAIDIWCYSYWFYWQLFQHNFWCNPPKQVYISIKPEAWMWQWWIPHPGGARVFARSVSWTHLQFWIWGLHENNLEIFLSYADGNPKIYGTDSPETPQHFKFVPLPPIDGHGQFSLMVQGDWNAASLHRVAVRGVFAPTAKDSCV